ncbi:MAG: YidC/Oxa1 family membrane protein insertase [Anaerolineae bacterium]|jgi:YidC/Oxa1 family membrane protein insertase|nr:YidC/Oxa1 family membrane protein insertase [Anaerolineae bacterium]
MWETLIIQPFINILLVIYQYLGQNFGIAIILFTILIRLASFPLTRKQMQSSKAMQDMNNDPEWKKIQEKYKDDREKLAQEQMKFYQEKGISPFASCLPTLIQFPLILGLYQSVIRTMAQTPMQMFELTKLVYKGDFWFSTDLLPLNSKFLWMNLGQPDLLEVNFLPFAIPIMAVLVAITSYMQSRLLTPPTTPGSGGQQDQTAMMSQTMSIYMPLFMAYLAYTLASGLSLYFLVGNLIGIAQYGLMGHAHWENLMFWKRPTPPEKREK